jgi:hypothetical protein
MTRITVAALMVAGLVPVLHAQEPFKWQGKLAAGKTIEIKNINGDVHASGGSGSDVTVTARKSARKSNPDDVEIRVVEHEDGVTICAVYPSRKNKPANDCRPGSHGHNDTDNNDVEVDFDVSVPKGVRFVGRSGQRFGQRRIDRRGRRGIHGEWGCAGNGERCRGSDDGQRLDRGDHGPQ